MNSNPSFPFLFAVLNQSGAEEITERAFLYQKLMRRYRHPAVAIVSNAALHLRNPGVSALPVIGIAIIGIAFPSDGYSDSAQARQTGAKRCLGRAVIVQSTGMCRYRLTTRTGNHCLNPEGEK